MARIDLETKMTMKTLHQQGVSNSETARLLHVSEGTVRYHLRRLHRGEHDGRADQPRVAAAFATAIDDWREAKGDAPVNLKELHEFLVAEYAYPGSLRSVQRFYSERYPRPRRRARRRIETPPGAQAQVDWAEFRNIWLGGSQQTLYAFHLELSHSRFGPIIWSTRKHQLAWLHCHNEALRRLDGVPATLRVDNEKTAVSQGAGAWGVINDSYRRYAQTARFHIDPCPPRAPNYKGKVERRIRDQRLRDDPAGRHWNDLAELQDWTDVRVAVDARRRICPATGQAVVDAFYAERRCLGSLPLLPEPFDVVVMRDVKPDCLVSFESRQYSVPFALLNHTVEVRGCAETVQILAGTEIVATHPRHTKARIVLDPSHYEGEATATVLPPPPLGKMGRKLADIAAMAPEQRPVDLYASLAEVAR